MSNILILADTRQQKDEHITRYFEENNVLWHRATLSTGDYFAIKCKNNMLYKDYSVIVDTKKDIIEICGNLCKSTEHERIKREIAKAQELGCKRFVFLIADAKVKDLATLGGWSSTRTKVKGFVLAKVMKTMQEKYGCEFIFCKKNEMGAKIVELLS